MYETSQKMEFRDLKYLLFSGFGGYPPLLPLTENHPAQKPLAERGGTPVPPPLTEKIRKVVFERFP